jgi:hypothetical protein
MPGRGTRDARRTERYLDELMTADERRSSAVPTDVDLDPAIRLAARELRAGLSRVHPSFRFEESLSARLAAGADRLKAGLPVEDPAARAAAGTVTHLPGRPAAPPKHDVWPPAAFRRWPVIAARPSRPLIVGGVGVGFASAALSLGAVYVAWRYSHPASGRMGRAVRAAHGRTIHSGHGRRTGVINGIRGVVS